MPAGKSGNDFNRLPLVGLGLSSSTNLLQIRQPSSSVSRNTLTSRYQRVQPENLQDASVNLNQQSSPSAAVFLKTYAYYRNLETITVQVTCEDPNAGTPELERFGIY